MDPAVNILDCKVNLKYTVCIFILFTSDALYWAKKCTSFKLKQVYTVVCWKKDIDQTPKEEMINVSDSSKSRKWSNFQIIKHQRSA